MVIANAYYSVIKKGPDKPRAGSFDQRHQVINDAKSLFTRFNTGFEQILSIYKYHKL